MFKHEQMARHRSLGGEQGEAAWNFLILGASVVLKVIRSDRAVGTDGYLSCRSSPRLRSIGSRVKKYDFFLLPAETI